MSIFEDLIDTFGLFGLIIIAIAFLIAIAPLFIWHHVKEIHELLEKISSDRN